MSQTAHRFYKDSRTPLSPVTPGAPIIAWSPQLVFSPGFYAYNTPYYDIRQPGLYRFTHYATPAENWSNTTHMIVYDGDPIALLSAAAWLTAFGDSDNSLSEAQMSAQARTSKLRLLCGPLHSWAANQLLTPCGVTSRAVHFITMDTPNNYVDGHICREVQIGGQWQLADLSNNVMFKDASGNVLSADDAWAAIGADAFDYDYLANDAYATELSGGYDATAYVESELLTETDRRNWHKRIFGAIGMPYGSEIWWKLPEGSEDRASWVESFPGYKVKPESVWNATFYP